MTERELSIGAHNYAERGSAPRLTSHLRALALIEPLHRVEDSKGLLHLADSTVIQHIDMRYLALAAIELLIERMGMGGTGSRDEVIDYLVGLAFAQCRQITDVDATALAEHVFDGLTNAREKRARFMTRLFDPGAPKGKVLEFALLSPEALPDGSVGYRLTPEAIEVHLSLLAHDPLTATQISEMIVEEFLKRGLYDHAVSAAERARTNSVRLAEAIRLLMGEARRAIRKVLWQDELGPHLEEARTLLDASIAREGAMLAHLNDTAADVTDETDRRHIAQVRKLLLDVQIRHRRLIVVVQNTAEEYLGLQADALKLRRATRLPDLENEILNPLLCAPLDLVGEVASEAFSSISAALPPLVLDLAATVSAFEPDLQSEEIVDQDVQVAPPSPPMQLPFDELMIERAESFARARIAEAGTLTLAEILDAAANAHPADAVFRRCLFLVLEQAIDPRTTDVTKGASILERRFDAGFVEGSDVRYSGTADAA